MSPPLPKAFISYSHDSTEHDERVRALADRLCGDGVDCTIDQYHPHPPEPWPRWMDRQIEEADFVLVVCTETYLRRAKGLEHPGVGLGVTFESVLITQDLYDAGMWNEKFFPVFFAGSSPQSIPKHLRGYTHYRADTESGYESLLRHLRNEPKIQKPEVRPGAPLPPVSSPGSSYRYRCMAQPPEEWVHRREYDEVLEALCPKDGVQTDRLVGITTALRGGGGFGKTALAQKLCFDERVQEAYPDGILWVTMGEDISESGRLSRVRDLIRWWTDKEAPTFETVAAAGAEIRKLLTGSRVLVVIDDAWNSSDIDPLKRPGKRIGTPDYDESSPFSSRDFNLHTRRRDGGFRGCVAFETRACRRRLISQGVRISDSSPGRMGTPVEARQWHFEKAGQRRPFGYGGSSARQ